MKYKHHSYKRCSICIAVAVSILLISFRAEAQVGDSLPFAPGMQESVDDALNHQLFGQQAKIDEAITEGIIRSKPADRYPSITMSSNFQHYIQNTYQERVKFRQLETQELWQYNPEYAKWNYLPTVSLFGHDSLGAQNDPFSKIYSLTLGVPIFQGTKRMQGIKQAEPELP